MDKLAITQVAVHELIARRWSARAIDPERTVGREMILSVLEAARWAPSCFGDEPWRFIVCDRHTDAGAWEQAHACLAEKNRLWAGNAPVLILAVADSRFRRDDKPNRWAQYDTGAASENLCLQAIALGLVAHQMGGFDAEAARQAFAIPEPFTPMAMIAIGYPGTLEQLPAQFHEAEQAERSRRVLGDNAFAGRWELAYHLGGD